MNLLKSLLTLAVVVALSPAYAQTNPAAEEKPYIEVTGTAEQEIVPDEIYVNIEIRERKDKVLIAEEEKLRTVIKDLGLSLSDLQLSNALADYVRVRQKSGNITIGKSYTLKVKDALTVGKLFYRLDKEEIAEANIKRLDHSQMDSLRKAIRTTAIKAAKAKADYLLGAIAEKTGKPMIIREVEYPVVATNYSRNKLAANETYEEYQSKWTQEVEFEKLTVRASVYIKFAIQ